MPLPSSSGIILYKKAMDAFNCNQLKEYIYSLPDEHVKELKYFLLSNGAKRNMPLLNMIYRLETKKNGNILYYERIRKSTMQ